MSHRREVIKWIVTIVEHGQGKAVIRFYEKNQIKVHFQSKGRGTASSDLLDVLGLGGTERDVVFSLAAGSLCDRLMKQLREEGGESLRVKGIAFLLPLNAISSIPGAQLLRQGKAENRNGGEGMEQEQENSLVLIVVNQGHTEEVMNTARAAGARGGTILRSRWAGQEEAASIYGIPLQAEKELIAIVASKEKRNVIMETIQKKHGRESEAGAILCSIGLEETVRLG
ncbi:MAG: hypothetical protein HFI33_03600 [Lachnospiraceae bacterium]|nr:hypothetical protein [Lachnospiraceae bacterium]